MWYMHTYICMHPVHSTWILELHVVHAHIHMHASGALNMDPCTAVCGAGVLPLRSATLVLPATDPGGPPYGAATATATASTTVRSRSHGQGDTQQRVHVHPPVYLPCCMRTQCPRGPWAARGWWVLNIRVPRTLLYLVQIPTMATSVTFAQLVLALNAERSATVIYLPSRLRVTDVPEAVERQYRRFCQSTSR